MKYIRTKDTEFRIGEILKILHEDEDYCECEGTFEKRMGCKAYVKKEIVTKVADSIEDLCDEFVVYVKDNIKVVRIFPKGKAMEYSTYLKQTDNLDSEIYGAIFTGKGLIYVAKMNDNGELELL